MRNEIPRSVIVAIIVAMGACGLFAIILAIRFWHDAGDIKSYDLAPPVTMQAPAQINLVSASQLQEPFVDDETFAAVQQAGKRDGKALADLNPAAFPGGEANSAIEVARATIGDVEEGKLVTLRIIDFIAANEPRVALEVAYRRPDGTRENIQYTVAYHRTGDVFVADQVETSLSGADAVAEKDTLSSE